MSKKIIAVFLCAVLVLSFAACAKKGSTDTQTDALKYNTFDGAYASYDASVVSAYEDMCRAVYRADGEVRFNTGMLNDVLQLFYTSFPLQIFVKDIERKDDASGITVTYTKSADEVRAEAKAFSDKIAAILDECKAGKTNRRAFIINAYHYTVTHVKESKKGGATIYSAVMNGEGDSFTASGMFEYLLRQGGVNASHILAQDAAGVSWGVSMAEIDGENFLFDPMTEIIANGGAQLCYFGMTTEDANAEGLKKFYYTNRAEAPACDNPYFDICRQCTAWEISENDTDLLVTQNNGEVVQVAL
ncbi:MAG: hypothetical protein E7520_07025 [Ruminococcaceae bacterium]|nr:hypothetical protein [Oscillospiraceae bacterium]